MDWRDVVDRLRHTKTPPMVSRLVGSVAPGHRIVLIQPIIRTARWGARWTRLVRRRSGRFERYLRDDPRVQRVGGTPRFSFRRGLPRGVRATIYRVRTVSRT
jgi:hypothetical protein